MAQANQTPEQIERQLKTIRDEIQELTEQVTDLVHDARADAVHSAKNEPVDAFREVADHFSANLRADAPDSRDEPSLTFGLDALASIARMQRNLHALRTLRSSEQDGSQIQPERISEPTTDETLSTITRMAFGVLDLLLSEAAKGGRVLVKRKNRQMFEVDIGG